MSERNIIHVRVGVGSDQTGKTYCGRYIYTHHTTSESNACTRDGRQFPPFTCKVCRKAYDRRER